MSHKKFLIFISVSFKIFLLYHLSKFLKYISLPPYDKQMEIDGNSASLDQRALLHPINAVQLAFHQQNKERA